MRQHRVLPFPVMAALLVAAAVSLPAHAYTIQNTAYHPSMCKLVPLLSANYASDLTVAGFVINPLANPAATATFICPVSLTSTISNPYLTNLSYSMDATSISSPPVQPTCQLVLDTLSSAINVINITGGSSGPDTNNYGGVNRAYLSCWITPGSVRFNRYTASMSYFSL